MPRLPPSLLKQARAISPHLVSLLPTCRDLPSARNELRWLREHVEKRALQNGVQCNSPTVHHELRRLCRERGRGKPLQYILGSEYFGELELLCRPGVLIPRPETADSIEYLVSRFQFRTGARASEWRLRILDLCTGSGCMSLLLHHALHRTFRKVTTETLGVDISSKALKVARDNLKHIGITSGTSSIRFKHADVLTTDLADPAHLHIVLKHEGPFDIIIANPPYISTSSFYKTTSKSVRNFEPRLALVPPHSHSPLSSSSPPPNLTPTPTPTHPADTFYPPIASLATHTHTSLLLLEVGSTTQAHRIASLLTSLTTLTPSGAKVPTWHAIEIWNDGILSSKVCTRRIHRSGPFHIPVIGPKEATEGRTVVCWRGEAVEWLRTECWIDGFWHEDERAGERFGGE